MIANPFGMTKSFLECEMVKENQFILFPCPNNHKPALSTSVRYNDACGHLRRCLRVMFSWSSPFSQSYRPPSLLYSRFLFLEFESFYKTMQLIPLRFNYSPTILRLKNNSKTLYCYPNWVQSPSCTAVQVEHVSRCE